MLCLVIDVEFLSSAEDLNKIENNEDDDEIHCIIIYYLSLICTIFIQKVLTSHYTIAMVKFTVAIVFFIFSNFLFILNTPSPQVKIEDID
jgi:hypothetical protein